MAYNPNQYGGSGSYGGSNRGSGQYGGPNSNPQERFGQPQNTGPQYGGPNSNPQDRFSQPQNTGPQYGGGQYGAGSQPNYGGPQNNPQPNVDVVKNLSETNMKLINQLAGKDTVIEEKTHEIESLNNHSRQLVEQISTTKLSSSDRVASLEREIQLLKGEIEEARVAKLRELESQRAFLQKEIDQVTKTVEDRDSRVAFLSGQLAKIKHDQEDESTRLSSFISKTMGALQLTGQNIQENGLTSPLLVESESNLGFSKLTIRSVVNPDGSVVNH